MEAACQLVDTDLVALQRIRACVETQLDLAERIQTVPPGQWRRRPGAAPGSLTDVTICAYVTHFPGVDVESGVSGRVTATLDLPAEAYNREAHCWRVGSQPAAGYVPAHVQALLEAQIGRSSGAYRRLAWLFISPDETAGREVAAAASTRGGALVEARIQAMAEMAILGRENHGDGQTHLGYVIPAEDAPPAGCNSFSAVVAAAEHAAAETDTPYSPSSDATSVGSVTRGGSGSMTAAAESAGTRKRRHTHSELPPLHTAMLQGGERRADVLAPLVNGIASPTREPTGQYIWTEDDFLYAPRSHPACTFRWPLREHAVRECVEGHIGRTAPGIPTAAPTRICACLLYTSPSPRDLSTSRMPSSA